MAATAIRAAIRPYSMAVAPLLFLISFFSISILLSPVGTQSIRRTKGGRGRNRGRPTLMTGLAAHLGRNVAEGRVQGRTDAAHRGDGGDGDQSGDQTIFDG